MRTQLLNCVMIVCIFFVLALRNIEKSLLATLCAKTDLLALFWEKFYSLLMRNSCLVQHFLLLLLYQDQFVISSSLELKQNVT